jgi:hypothetical protein
MNFSFKGKEYCSNDYIVDIPSIHICGVNDPIYTIGQMDLEANYSNNPIALTHEGTHHMPKALSKGDFEKLKDFIKVQYKAKFGEDESFVIKHEKYDQEILFRK